MTKQEKLFRERLKGYGKSPEIIDLASSFLIPLVDAFEQKGFLRPTIGPIDVACAITHATERSVNHVIFVQNRRPSTPHPQQVLVSACDLSPYVIHRFELFFEPRMDREEIERIDQLLAIYGFRDSRAWIDGLIKDTPWEEVRGRLTNLFDTLRIALTGVLAAGDVEQLHRIGPILRYLSEGFPLGELKERPGTFLVLTA